MRKIGEKRLSSIPSTKRIARTKAYKEWHTIKCLSCPATKYVKLAMLKFYKNGSDGGYICPECRTDSKKQVKQAMLNIYRKKNAIKKR